MPSSLSEFDKHPNEELFRVFKHWMNIQQIRTTAAQLFTNFPGNSLNKSCDRILSGINNPNVLLMLSVLSVAADSIRWSDTKMSFLLRLISRGQLGILIKVIDETYADVAEFPTSSPAGLMNYAPTGQFLSATAKPFCPAR